MDGELLVMIRRVLSRVTLVDEENDDRRLDGVGLDRPQASRGCFQLGPGNT